MAIGECSQFWTNGRQPLPYWITEGLPVTREPSQNTLRCSKFDHITTG
jgi:hypothetical protein